MIAGTRYLVILPVLGLSLAAAFFFVLGGVGLIALLIEILSGLLGFSHEAPKDKSVITFEVVEYVHIFLVGTVLYITAIGLYQLFVREVDMPAWLRIENTEELETSLISVTIVVLAVNFMGTMLVGTQENLLNFGAGIALPIAALALFIGLRAWATKMGKQSAITHVRTKPSPGSEQTAKAEAEAES
jgi:uncharacterized membrane protein YqhA